MPQNPQSGFTQSAAASRSQCFHKPMNPPKHPNVLINYLARILPLDSYQHGVYFLGQKHPPGFEDGFAPIWEVATALLPSRQTTQLRINFQREFYLLGIMGSSSQAGGFRAQVYDMKKSYRKWLRPSRWIDSNGNLQERLASNEWGKPGVRLAGRGVLSSNYFGGTASSLAPGSPQPFFLREPHPFTEPDAQALIVVQNQDTSGNNNQIQVALYGVARRFNWPD